MAPLPPTVGCAFLSSLPFSMKFFFSASARCCAQASQLTGCPDGSSRRFGGIKESLSASIIDPLQWFPSFFWCIYPQGPTALPCLPKGVCAVRIRLSQSSVADPSEIARRAQSAPRPENRVLAPVGCSTAEEPQGAGRGGEAVPAWLSSCGWRWDSPWESPTHSAAQHAREAFF